MLVAPDFPVTEKKKERKEKEKKLGFVRDFNLRMHFSVRAVTFWRHKTRRFKTQVITLKQIILIYSRLEDLSVWAIPGTVSPKEVYFAAGQAQQL